MFVYFLSPHSYEQKTQTAVLGFDPQKRIPILDPTNWANLRFSAAAIKGNQESVPGAELKDRVPTGAAQQIWEAEAGKLFPANRY